MEWWSSSSNESVFCLLRKSIVSDRRSRDKLDGDRSRSMVEMVVFVEGIASLLVEATSNDRGSIKMDIRCAMIDFVPRGEVLFVWI